jgi:hypothetical protein
MRRLVAAVALGTMLVGMVVTPAHAGGAARDALLAFGAFTLFTQFLLAPFLVRPFYAAPAPVAYASPPAVYATATATYAAPTTYAPPAAPRVLVAREVVVHPHGRYVLRGDGVTVAYQWIWVPSPPTGAPPPPPR